MTFDKIRSNDKIRFDNLSFIFTNNMSVNAKYEFVTSKLWTLKSVILL